MASPPGQIEWDQKEILVFGGNVLSWASKKKKNKKKKKKKKKKNNKAFQEFFHYPTLEIRAQLRDI